MYTSILGNKKTYESWEAAFFVCIDKATATPEYKLLQSRQYLSGESLKTIKKLRYSGYVYEAAKERLEHKFGGQRHQNAIIKREELENFKPLRPNNSKDWEDFGDLLDIAVINLKKAGRSAELGDGSTRTLRLNPWKLCKLKWVIQESRFHSIAHETVRCLAKGDLRPAGQCKINTFFAQPSISNRRQ